MTAKDTSPFSADVRRCADALGRQGVTALGELYDLTAVRVVRYALTLTRNQHDAEDALQAAMVRIALNPRVLSRARYPWAYFLKVVRNEALKIGQQKKPTAHLAALHGLGQEDAPHLEDTELRRMVRRALDALPPAQSEVVVLKVWEEMTFAEIGEVLGQSPNTAASRYRYALDKLAKSLQPQYGKVTYA